MQEYRTRDGFGYQAQDGTVLAFASLGLITDRTWADVQRVAELAAKGYDAMTAAERAEWDGGLKGAYNAADLNRVEDAVGYLADSLAALPQELRALADGLGVAWDKLFDLPYSAADYESLSIRTDWADAALPRRSEMARYLSNVVQITKAFAGKYPTLPASMEALTYVSANAIEDALETADSLMADARKLREDYITNTAAFWCYSGEIFSGA